MLWNDNDEIQPSNGVECLVEFSDGSRAIAKQYCGEWPDGMLIIKWRFLTEDDENKINEFLKILV